MDNNITSWKHYIGVDPSLRSSGIAVISVTDTGVYRRTLCVAPAKGLSGPLELAYIYRTTKAWLEGIIGDGTAVIACIEGPSLGSVGRQDVLGEVRGVFKLLLVMMKSMPAIVVVAPTSLKKFGAGSGGADKEKVKEGMQAYGWRAKTLDEYDAAALAEFGYAKRNGDTPLTRAQREAITPRKKPIRRKTKFSGLNV